jgi:hypothetical protein
VRSQLPDPQSRIRAAAARSDVDYGRFFGLARAGAWSLTGGVQLDGVPWWATPRRMRRLDQEILGRGLPRTMSSR